MLFQSITRVCALHRAALTAGLAIAWAFTSAPALCAPLASPAAPPATFPDQQRAAGTPQVVARGKQLYSVNCKACHGSDLRGGDLGGPNLLRSPVVMSDRDGEAISQVVLKGRPNPPAGAPPMPAFPLSSSDAHAIAEYLHDVLRDMQHQGAPPPGSQRALNILVGNAAAGRRYFKAYCSRCHSPTGDLKGIATRAADAGALQDAWVGGRPPVMPGTSPYAIHANSKVPPTRVTVTLNDGTQVQGRLQRIDDFTVSLYADDGAYRAFVRDGKPGVRAVAIEDPMAAHRHLLGVLTDRDMHNVTAYLATLK